MFRFVDRTEELAFMEEKFKEIPQLIILYGRRRVGKTELIKEFCRNKNFIYFLADRRGTLINAERFASIAANHFDDIPPAVKNFDDVFRYIVKRLEKKTIVAIDEFSYLVEKDDAVPSVFQLIYDEIIKNEDIMLILAGSSISMMEKGVLSYKSPLYGRRTGQWKIKPFMLKELRAFHHLPMETAIHAYAVFGGVPQYLSEFDAEKDIFENISEKIFKKGSVLYEEVDFLLREELRDYSTYLSILEAIALGNTRVVEIANHARINAKDVPKYINILIKLDLIKREHPITEKERTKKTIYEIKDNFFRFWFRFAYPNKSGLELGNSDKVLSMAKHDFNSFVGRTFEDVAKEFLIELNSRGSLPINFTRIGKWWQKEEEIDIIALNERTKEILFGECKWQNKKINLSELKRLKDKAMRVKWNGGARKEYYTLFSKSGFGDELLELEGENILLYDIDAMEDVL